MSILIKLCNILYASTGSSCSNLSLLSSSPSSLLCFGVVFSMPPKISKHQKAWMKCSWSHIRDTMVLNGCIIWRLLIMKFCGKSSTTKVHVDENKFAIASFGWNCWIRGLYKLINDVFKNLSLIDWSFGRSYSCCDQNLILPPCVFTGIYTWILYKIDHLISMNWGDSWN